MIARLLPLLAVALLAAKDDPLAGRVAGPAQRCVPTSTSNDGPIILDNNSFAYRESGKRLWVTHPIGPCPALRPLTTLIVERWGASQCENDRFRVLEPGMSIPSGICRFGPFVPYDKVTPDGKK